MNSIKLAIALLLISSSHVLTAQPQHRALLAHYPLMSNLEDITGMHPALTVQNILIQDSAVYSDGANSFSDTANRINGFFPLIDHDDVYLALDFKIDSIPNDQLSRSILVGGSGWRWLAATYRQSTGEISFRYNNWKIAPGKFKFEYDTWYHLVLTYQRTLQTGQMLIDGELIATDSFNLDAANDCSIVLDCFCGYHAMGGYWKNLMVYGPDTTLLVSDSMIVDTMVIDTMSMRDSMYVQCQIEKHLSDREASDGNIKLIIAGGTPPYTISSIIENEPWVHETDTSVVRAEFLPAGDYLFSVLDSTGLKDTCTIELKPPQTDLPLISHFPLTIDGEDILGTHPDIALTNVPLDGSKGMFSPNYVNRDTFSQARIFLSELDLDHFFISLEVNIDSIENDFGKDKRSIFVLGHGWRELAPVYHQNAQNFALNVNNWQATNGTSRFEYDRWYEVAAGYDKDAGIVTLYIDREQIVSDSAILETNNDRSLVLWCNCGPSPLQGYWRNLKIYSKRDQTTSSARSDAAQPLHIFPNPVQDMLTINRKYVPHQPFLRILDGTGRMVLEKKINPGAGPLRINVQPLTPGIYFIQWRSVSTSFLKQ